MNASRTALLERTTEIARVSLASLKNIMTKYEVL